MSALVLFLSLTSCSKEEIDMYSQEARINFDYRTIYSELRDSDYVKMKTDPYRRDSVRVRIMGDLLTANRDFCIKKTENSAYANTLDIQLDDKYTYSALDAVCQYVYFKVKRPAYKTGRKTYGCNLEFDLTNPNHQFEKGFVEDNSVEVNYVWDITEPKTWSDWYWLGDFSPIKYCYMMTYGEEHLILSLLLKVMRTIMMRLMLPSSNWMQPIRLIKRSMVQYLMKMVTISSQMKKNKKKSKS